MKGKLTYLSRLLIAGLLLFSMSAVGQTFTELWRVSETANGGGWMHYYRGIAYGNDHLYVAGTLGSSTFVQTNQLVRVIDIYTGETLDTLDNTGVTPYGYGLRTVQVSDDGSILAANMTLDASAAHPVVIWRWKDEFSQPDSFTCLKVAGRVDMFTVVGDVTKNAVIMAGVNGNSKVTRRIITDGVIGDETVISLIGLPSTGSITNVCPTGVGATDKFWYNNTAISPILYNADGTMVGQIPAALFTAGTTGTMKNFTYNEKEYLQVADSGFSRLIDITGKLPQDLTINDVVFSNPASVNNIYQDVDYRIGEDGSLSLYSFSEVNYISAMVTEAAPIAMDLLMTGFAMVDSLAQVTYTYVDINGDAEGLSLYSWYLSDDDQGTNKTKVGTGNSYTFNYEDLNKYVSFDVLAVALTGTAYDSANLVMSEYFGPVTASAHKPTAADLAITGDASVYSILTGSYTFADEDDDLEGESILKWWKADDASGTNAVQIAADTNMYKVMPTDTAKFIIFSVIPVSQSPNFSQGDSAAVATAEEVIFPAFAPEASNVDISGIEEVSRILSGAYTYSDLNLDIEGATELKWYRADNATAEKAVVASDTNRYELVAADEGKIVFFGVKPVTELGEVGTEVFDTTGVIAPKPAEAPPVAQNVTLKGNAEVGVLLSGTYTYFDYTDDAEGETIIKWYVADDATAANKTEITGAAGKQTYLVPEQYLGKYFVFEVTPVALTGGLLVGTPVLDTTIAATVADANDGDFERVFIGAAKSNTLPYYMAATGSVERNFAIGDEHIYIASRNGGTRLYMLDKTDGSYIGEMNTEGMDIGLFKISDVEVSADGQILACPLQINASTEPFVIYKWENELAAPVKWIEYTATEALRLGDKFTVVGDVSDEAVIYAVASAGSKVVRWAVTGGVVGEPTVIALEGTTSVGSTPAAYPYSVSAESNFIVDGRGFQAQIFDKDGMKVGALEGIGQSNNQSNSPNIFYYKGRTMVAFHQKNEASKWNIIVQDITSIPHVTVGVSEVLSDANQELGGVHVEVDDEFFHLYMLSANNGIARFKGLLELPTIQYAETSTDGNMLHAWFSKNMTDSVGFATGWTVMVNDAQVAVDTLYGGTGDNELAFELASAITEGQVVTINYDGSGTVVSFDGMPLGAFESAFNVVNIVGADVPTASNVSIVGNPYKDSTLIGNYTFADLDGDLEGASEYQWWYASDENGTDKLKVLGGTNKTYVVEADYNGKYLAFEVTPVSATGGMDYLVGEPAMSTFVKVLVVGIGQDAMSAIAVFPNPVNRQLTITDTRNIVTVQVIDYTGRLVMTQNNQGENELSINVSSLQPGVYMVQLVDTNNQTFVRKIVKE
ncbi:MAG: hypothetical protein A2W95_19410 [Bacteroidetes bacterium GWA2_40_14]|nr:MAG: hypothetical protein A2W95_19410 [Bacteroidetes bacterium GWA2_40_14]